MEKRRLMIKLLIIAAPVVMAVTVSGFREEGKCKASEEMRAEASAAGDGSAADTGETKSQEAAAERADTTGLADTESCHLKLRLDKETYRFPVSYRDSITRGFR